MPVNPMNVLMEFTPADVLELNVEEFAPAPAVNHIANPHPVDPAARWGFYIHPDIESAYVDAKSTQSVWDPHDPNDLAYAVPARTVAAVSAEATTTTSVTLTFTQSNLDRLKLGGGVRVGSSLYVLNVAALATAAAPQLVLPAYALNNPDGTFPMELIVTASTTTTVTVTTPSAVTVGAITLPSNHFVRANGSLFALGAGYDQSAGQDGTAPFTTFDSSTPFAVTAGLAYQLTVDFNGTVRIRTGAGARNTSAHTITLEMQWRDISGAAITPHTATSPSGTDTTYRGVRTLTGTVPAGAVTAQFIVRINVPSMTNVANPNMTVHWMMSDVSYFEAATAGQINPNAQPAPMSNILGDATKVSIGRETLNVGTLTFRMKGDAYDPLQTDRLAKGRKVQMKIVEPAHRNWLFTGKISKVSATYPLLNGVVTPIVTVTCTDAAQTWANVSAPDVAHSRLYLDELAHQVAEPFEMTVVVGDGAGGGGAGDLDFFGMKVDSMSMLDQVVLTRDTWQDYAWIDRIGWLRYFGRVAIDELLDSTFEGRPGAPRSFTVGEADYQAGVTPTYDSDRIINSVIVKALRRIGDQTEEWTFGPYIDAVSVQKYGESPAEFRVTTDPTQSYGASAFASFASAILARSSTPALLFTPVPFHITKLSALDRASADLGDVFLISNTDAGYVDVPHRVASIQHEITPWSWTMTGGFEKELDTQTPTRTPSPVANSREAPAPIDSDDVTWAAAMTGAKSIYTKVIRDTDGNYLLYLRMAFQRAGLTAFDQTVFTLPASHTPATQVEDPAAVNDTNPASAYFVLLTNRQLRVRGAGTWPTNTSTYFIGSMLVPLATT